MNKLIKNDLKNLIRWNKRLAADLTKLFAEMPNEVNENNEKIYLTSAFATVFDDILIECEINKEDFITFWKDVPLDLSDADASLFIGLEALKEGESECPYAE